MKKSLILLFLLFGIMAQAQKADRHERIMMLKIPFITDELDLTSAEAEKFWPIYNSYDAKLNELRERERKLFKEKYATKGVKNNLTDGEAKAIIERYSTIVSERHNLERELLNKLINKLPASKMVFLPEVERKFNRKLFDEFRKREMK